MISTLLKRGGWVTGGNAVGQGLIVLSTIWLARAYSPADFGSLAVVFVISNISVALACMRFDIAIPAAPRADVDGLLLISVAASLASAFVVVMALVALTRLSGISMPLVHDQPHLVFLTISLSGLLQVYTAYLVRLERFKSIGSIRAAQGLVFVVLASFPIVGLLWGQVLSLSIGVLALVVVLPLIRGHSPASMVGLARRYWRLPVLSLPGAALDVVGYSLLIWVVIGVYGPEEAGTYSQLQRLIGGPLMLISIGLGQVLLRQTVDYLEDPGQMRLLLGKTLLGLALLSGAVVVGVTLLGEPIIRLILGPQWTIDQGLAVWAAAAVAVRACVSPLSSVLITLRRFDLGLAWQATYFMSAAILFPAMAHRLEFQAFIAFYALHEAALYSVYLYLIWHALTKVETG